MKKRTIIYIIGALLVVGLISTSVYVYQSNLGQTKTNQTQQEVLSTSSSKEITYAGKDGVTALTLLGQKAKIVTSGTGDGAFVTSINGLAANPKNEFWAFNVNSKPAVVGAGSYVSKSSDTITWKLSSF